MIETRRKMSTSSCARAARRLTATVPHPIDAGVFVSGFGALEVITAGPPPVPGELFIFPENESAVDVEKAASLHAFRTPGTHPRGPLLLNTRKHEFKCNQTPNQDVEQEQLRMFGAEEAGKQHGEVRLVPPCRRVRLSSKSKA